MNKTRWRYLHDLIVNRIEDAKENLARTLVTQIHALTQEKELDDAARLARTTSLERRIWKYFADGELDTSQHEMLLRLLRESKSKSAKRE